MICNISLGISLITRKRIQKFFSFMDISAYFIFYFRINMKNAHSTNI